MNAWKENPVTPEASADSAPHPWHRLVALGDSFTEGIGDPEPLSGGGYRGWADRVAEELSGNQPDFAYANLAVRGRLVRQILDEQLSPALDLKPDLVTLSAGGNVYAIDAATGAKPLQPDEQVDPDLLERFDT